MAATDKDVHQKEKAIKYCLSTGLIPFYEVNVTNLRELSDTPELLTDVDVLGIKFDRGSPSRIIFDCKTNNKTSPINRAFWAAGLMRYVDASEAFVVLKKSASEGHKLSAKGMHVHLFDEKLFDSHAAALAPSYLDKDRYAYNIENWHILHGVLRSNPALVKLGEFIRSTLPIESDFAKNLRGTVAHVRAIKGELDPNRPQHMAVYCFCVFSLSFSLAPIIRAFFDIFDQDQSKETFEKLLRYYIWGGRDAYYLRRKMRELVATTNDQVSPEFDLGAWEDFLEMARALLDAPAEVFTCCTPLLNMTLRYIGKQTLQADTNLAVELTRSNRTRQFIFRISSYLVSGTGLPKEFHDRLKSDLNSIIASKT